MARETGYASSTMHRIWKEGQVERRTNDYKVERFFVELLSLNWSTRSASISKS